MHVYLAPHPDDAAFSCGAQIAERTGRGESVLIYTVMAGAPPAHLIPNPFISEHHERWGLGLAGDQVVSARRQEDAAAAAALGAMIRYGETPEALYRADRETGEGFYQDRAALFGTPHPAEADLPNELVAAFSAAISEPLTALYAPLGVGGHVDHQLTRSLGLALALANPDLKMYFYEEYPYSRQERRVILAALQAFAQPLMRITVAIRPETLAAKIRASACYHSQLSTFWADEAALGEELTAYHATTGGEVLWRLLRAED
ncbi:MAG TPA: PIG-L family deacetylase [Aggregatilineales bacterium]|nr:PIG-L family deacetylase [Anaerolineales bacterium]HRE49729.1 PIG-L family deacetylase [Aggregatilineales bacterium]